jgi:uncharacterized repeat protein (TIGR03803 family)
MTNPEQHHDWIPRIYFRGTAVALLVVIVLAVFATPSAQSQTFTALHNFTGYPKDGAVPVAGLVVDAKGNLYGTTNKGGTSNFGTVFEVSTAGKETVLYSFIHGTDGATPFAGLVRDDKGNLYGTALGGTSGSGVVFKVAGKKETVLYSFTGGSDGSGPLAGLVMDAKGNLYGTT